MIISGLLLLGGTKIVTAQGREFGLRAGAMGSQTFNDGEQVESFLPGFYGGFFVGRPLGSTFFTSFISGLEYLQGGYMADDRNFRRLNYLGIPLGVRFYFGPWYLQPGVYANFKFYERWVDDDQDILNINNRSLFFDLPVQLAAGVKIIDVSVELRYLIGWINVYEGNRNSALQLGLAYTF